ncbi:hypothetical protein ACFCWY_33640 [Streptomyces sp. NPDC056362]|uniref:hypothetical protein n=1 Tax=unclassified Streptomyces TaxID=2593676 RepID=UPI0035D6A459
MSDMYEEFDADAEEALDALFARHQEGLAATVGPALDVAFGLRWASELKSSFVKYLSDVRAAQSIASGTHLVSPWVFNGPLPLPTFESSSLNGVLEAVLQERRELAAFAQQLAARSTTIDAETEWLAVQVAVSGARDELDRILVLLAGGKLTKETAKAEFEPALGLLEEQLYVRTENTWEGDDELPDKVVWVNGCLTARASGLRRLREQVVRLFDDSDACAFQLS